MKHLALVLFFCMAGMLQATTFYVALNGNDSWSGTLAAPNGTNTDGPWRTLPHAQSVMNGSSTKTVTIRAGTYVLSANLQFFSSSNGQTWIPFQNESVVIDGNSGTYGLTGSSVANLSIEGLTFQHMKNTALNFNGRADHLTLRWNTFLNCIDLCVAGVITNSLIDSNTVNGETRVSLSGSAFLGWAGSSGNTITQNLIENMEGGAITFGAANDLVDRNKIINVNTSNNDWGAIYTGHAPGTWPYSGYSGHITNNYISGNGGVNFASDSIKAIYLDDLVSNVTVSGNICQKCGSYGFQIHGGTSNTIINNIFDVSSQSHGLGLYQVSSVQDTGMSGNVFTKNIIYTSCTVPTLWTTFVNGGDAKPADSHNLYYSGCGASVPNTGIVDASPVYANPQFTDPANGDYSMPGGSPAFSIGFTALPTDQGPLPNPFVSTGTPPAISSFTATPASISSGASSTLAWSIAGATSLSINQGIGTVTGTTSRSVSPTLTTAYILTASNSSGSVTRSVTVTVTGSTVLAPTITAFTASPSTPIVPGTAVTLTWTSTNGSTATLNGSSVALNGSQVVSPTVTTPYALVVSNSTGTASQTVTVNVGALPVISSFTASPSTIALGGSSTLALSSTGGTSCSIDQGVGTVACNSSTPVSPLTSKLYTVTVTNSFGSKTATALVGVSISALIGASVVDGQVVIH